jgi:hypothetical protein
MSNTPDVLIIGRSQLVLDRAVALLAERGVVARATNDFDGVSGLLGAGSPRLTVFGGQVPPAKREEIRGEIEAHNPHARFLQGLAGIPGLIADQVEQALDGERPVPGQTPRYDAARRAILLDLYAPLDVRVTTYWVTAPVPPDPASEARVLFDGALGPGEHAFALGADIALDAAFATVRAGAAGWSFRLL